jgi:hypothetical protein
MGEAVLYQAEAGLVEMNNSKRRQSIGSSAAKSQMSAVPLNLADLSNLKPSMMQATVLLDPIAAEISVKTQSR